jgi:hypothetical protein
VTEIWVHLLLGLLMLAALGLVGIAGVLVALLFDWVSSVVRRHRARRSIYSQREWQRWRR